MIPPRWLVRESPRLRIQNRTGLHFLRDTCVVAMASGAAKPEPASTPPTNAMVRVENGR